MRSLVSIGAAVLLIAEDCPTTLPASDSTPPSLEWVVTRVAPDPPFEVRINGSGTLPVRHGEEYQVILNARDPEGIHKISLGGDGNYFCVGLQGGGLTELVPVGQAATDVQTLSPNSNNEVLPQVPLIRNVNFLNWDCRENFALYAGRIRLNGVVENYFDGKVEGTLILSVVPGERRD